MFSGNVKDLHFQDGDRFWRMPECYIRGSTIKYLRIPDEVIDMVKEEVIQKSKGRGDMKGRGGAQRGRGGRGKYRIEIIKHATRILNFMYLCPKLFI